MHVQPHHNVYSVLRFKVSHFICLLQYSKTYHNLRSGKSQFTLWRHILFMEKVLMSNFEFH